MHLQGVGKVAFKKTALLKEKKLGVHAVIIQIPQQVEQAFLNPAGTQILLEKGNSFLQHLYTPQAFVIRFRKGRVSLIFRLLSAIDPMIPIKGFETRKRGEIRGKTGLQLPQRTDQQLGIQGRLLCGNTGIQPDAAHRLIREKLCFSRIFILGEIVFRQPDAVNSRANIRHAHASLGFLLDHDFRS